MNITKLTNCTTTTIYNPTGFSLNKYNDDRDKNTPTCEEKHAKV